MTEKSNVMGTLIYQKLAAIQQEVKPIAKTQENTGQHYKYRGIEEIAAQLHELFARHEILCVPYVESVEFEGVTTKSGAKMMHCMAQVAFHFSATDGSTVIARTIGEGMDTGDKAANKAMTAAQKYVLTQTFTIPWGHDSEGENLEPLGAAPQAPTPRPVAQAGPRPLAPALALQARDDRPITPGEKKKLWGQSFECHKTLGFAKDVIDNMEPKTKFAPMNYALKVMGVDHISNVMLSQVSGVEAALAHFVEERGQDAVPNEDEVPF